MQRKKCFLLLKKERKKRKNTGNFCFFLYLTIATLNTHFLKFKFCMGSVIHFLFVCFVWLLSGIIPFMVSPFLIPKGKNKMAFNVRVIDYPAGKQVRIYDKVVDASADNVWSSVENETELEYCPFTEKMERVQDFCSFEHSAAVSRARTINRLYYLARSNEWEWFVTLTFSPEKVNRFDYTECTKKVSKWLNHCRRKSPKMKYLVVPEQHKSGAWHFHGLLANVDELGFVDSGKRDRKGKKIYNIGTYRFGFTTATRVTDMEKVSKYISKYITKDLCAVTVNKKRFWASRNLSEAPVIDYCLEAEEKRSFQLMIADSIKYMKTVKSVYCRTDYIELEKD